MNTPTRSCSRLVLIALLAASAQWPSCAQGTSQQGPADGRKTIGNSIIVPLQVREVPWKESHTVYLSAQKLFDDGDIAGAEAACMRALDLAPVSDKTGVSVNVPAVRLLGDIRLKQGKPREALGAYLPCLQETSNRALRLSVAIAYCEVGDYRAALQQTQDILSMSSDLRDLDCEPADWPGARTVRSLEASLYCYRAMTPGVWRRPKALSDYRAALKLAPHNAYINYQMGEVLRSMYRVEECLPYFRAAAAASRGKIAAQSKENIKHMEYGLREKARLAKERETLKPLDTGAKP